LHPKSVIGVVPVSAIGVQSPRGSAHFEADLAGRLYVGSTVRSDASKCHRWCA
jgi:hypothetical protein